MLTLLDSFQLCLIILFGWLAVLAIGRYFGLSATRTSLIHFYHIGFSFIYANYALKNPVDATRYIYEAERTAFSLVPGYESIHYLTAILMNDLKLEYFSLFQVYAFIGVIGLLALDGVLKLINQGKNCWIKGLGSLVVFFPTANFWSAAIGKDCFSLTAVCLVLWAALDWKKRIPLFAFGVILLFYVRPHIGGIMALAAALAFIFEPEIKPSQRLILIGLGCVLSAVFLYFVSRMINVAFDIKELINFIERRQIVNQQGVSSINIADSTILENMMSFMFRPLPFELPGLAALMTASENLILILIAVICLGFFWLKDDSRTSMSYTFLWTYGLGTWMLLALTIPNLGIAVRQKWMFLPIFLAIGFNELGGKRKNLNESRVKL